MVGPPGVGKTMLARRLPGILPPPTSDEALEITRVRSVVGAEARALVTERPFRAPHHTISASGLVGGGTTPQPGEVTLAHHGVLFLDELAEFARSALEALRQPLEEGRVEVVRGQRAISYPARFTLVAACNPCPCARAPDRCSCSEPELRRYTRRLSGPLLDRIDIFCDVGRVGRARIFGDEAAAPEPSSAVATRVAAARSRQLVRLAGTRAGSNAAMDGRLTRRLVQLGADASLRLADPAVAEALSGRGVDRVLRVARTIADLAGREAVSRDDLDEALGYRATPVTWLAA
jgi:magnesium chelatase family protein